MRLRFGLEDERNILAAEKLAAAAALPPLASLVLPAAIAQVNGPLLLAAELASTTDSLLSALISYTPRSPLAPESITRLQLANKIVAAGRQTGQGWREWMTLTQTGVLLLETAAPVH